MGPPQNTRPVSRGLGRRVADIITMPADGTSPAVLLHGPSAIPFEAVPLPMLVADSSGDVLAANHRWEKLSGLNAVESLGLGWHRAVRPEGAFRLRQEVNRVAAGGGHTTVDCEWAATPGAWARWWLGWYQRAGQHLVGMVVVESGELGRQGGELGAESFGELLAELPGLFVSLDGLLQTLLDVLEWDDGHPENPSRPTTGRLSAMPPVEPRNTASPKVNTPPSEATIQ